MWVVIDIYNEENIIQRISSSFKSWQLSNKNDKTLVRSKGYVDFATMASQYYFDK